MRVLDQSFEKRISDLKQQMVKEICGELKGKVVSTWKEGTDRFFNDAKSIMSDYSRSPSVASDISRSRSVSRDFINTTKQKSVNNQFRFAAHESLADQTFEEENLSFNKPERKASKSSAIGKPTEVASKPESLFGFKPPVQETAPTTIFGVKAISDRQEPTSVFASSPAFGQPSTSGAKKETGPILTDKIV